MSDFSNVIDIAGTFLAFEEDTGVDFVASGDSGVLIIPGVGFGEGGFGEGPFGGTSTIILSVSTTAWTDIDEP